MEIPKVKKENVIMYYVGMLTILGSFIIMGTIAYWLLYPYKVFEITKRSSPEKSSYSVGEYIFYDVDYCKYMALPATVTIQFVDEIIYTMPSFTTNNPPGCNKSKGSVLVPPLPVSSYNLRVTYTYNVNPIRTWSYSYETTKFNLSK